MDQSSQNEREGGKYGISSELNPSDEELKIVLLAFGSFLDSRISIHSVFLIFHSFMSSHVTRIQWFIFNCSDDMKLRKFCRKINYESFILTEWKVRCQVFYIISFIISLLFNTVSCGIYNLPSRSKLYLLQIILFGVSVIRFHNFAWMTKYKYMIKMTEKPETTEHSTNCNKLPSESIIGWQQPSC